MRPALRVQAGEPARPRRTLVDEERAPVGDGVQTKARQLPDPAARHSAILKSMRDRLNLTQSWLAEKLAAPELWSVRDRDDIVYFIEKRRRELTKIPEDHQPMRQDREEALAALEAAMDAHLRATDTGLDWPEA